MAEPIRISTNPTPEQVAAIVAAGPGATVHHPLASYPGRRRELGMALGRAGVPHRLVRTLGWSSRGPERKPQESEPAKPKRWTKKAKRDSSGSDPVEAG